MAELGGKTKIGFAKAAHKVAKHCAKQQPTALIEQAQGARHWSAVAATVHGWEKQAAGSEGSLNLNVLAGRGGRVLVAVANPVATDVESSALPSTDNPS
jgi:hypothetical protein